MQDKKIKIALVGYKLAKGGLERSFSVVSELLYQSNYDIHVIVLENEIEYSYQGTLLNLGYYSKFKKYFKLKQYLKKNRFDYVIDFRHRINPWMELLFIHYIFAGFKVIYTIHSSKLEVYLTSNAWVARQILYKAFKIVVVSKTLNEKIKAVGVETIMKDNIQSARLGGFGNSDLAVEIFIEEVDFGKANAVIEEFRLSI